VRDAACHRGTPTASDKSEEHFTPLRDCAFSQIPALTITHTTLISS